jgi:hypothetical protein
MSSNPNFNAPVLNYVGSVDVASATSGSTLYNILFDASLCILGNVLMFEYKIQPQNVVVPDPNNITLGYVNVENAIFNSGIGNQWTITVPSRNNIYNPTIPQEIAVRVYSGLTGSTEISVTPWSNILDVHDPPEQPLIVVAFFDDNTLSQDDLWVVMPINTTYDYNEVQFIVAYYFQDSNNNTVWGVSDPQYATDTTYSGESSKLLFINNIGSIDTYHKAVYVSIYTVFPFTNNGSKYYSVSEISQTVEADPAGDLSAPTITSIDYNVYVVPPTQPTIPGNQTMNVNWIPPAISSIRPFTVDHYVLQISTNSGTTWTDISDSIPANILTYNVDVSSYGCGTNVSFRVFAFSTTGSESLPSNILSKYIFKYSTAPQNLVVTSSSSSGTSLQDISLSFQNPADIGCGSGYQFVITFTDSNSNIVTKTVPYNAGTITYTPSYTGLNISSSGTVTVYLQTQDTNSSDYENGVSISVPFISAKLFLDPIDYQVYVNDSQDMILTWNNPTIGTSWIVDSYKVYLGSTLLTTITDGSTTYTYPATQDCGTELTFNVVASTSNSTTTYSITSNNQSVNIFKYATAPSLILVDWATTDINLTILDMAVTFQVSNPYNSGCGTIIQWILQVLDLDNNVISTKNIPYTEGTTSYTTIIDNAPYVPSGNVKVFMTTYDTNSSNIMNGTSVSTSFIASDLPLITNIVINNDRSQLTFDVYTEVALSKVARFIWVVSGQSPPPRRENKLFYTNNIPPTTGESVIETIIENNVQKYSYTFTPEFFASAQIPLNLMVAVANNVGISVENVSN